MYNFESLLYTLVISKLSISTNNGDFSFGVNYIFNSKDRKFETTIIELREYFTTCKIEKIARDHDFSFTRQVQHPISDDSAFLKNPSYSLNLNQWTATDSQWLFTDGSSYKSFPENQWKLQVGVIKPAIYFNDRWTRLF